MNDHAPPRPEGDWMDALHWMIGALPVRHRDTGFVASLLGQAATRPGLTERQERCAEKIYDRLFAEWQAAQRTTATSGLTDMIPAGRA